MSEIPDGMDMRVEVVDSELGMKEIKITAFSEQAEIDLQMEYPRICKLLERDWLYKREDAGRE